MTDLRFILIAALIFTAKFFLASLFPFWLLADPFIILALAVFFFKNQQVHLAVFLAIAIFFDFWSGEVFGVTTLSLLFSILVIFLAKQVLLLDQTGWGASLFLIVIFYYLIIFLQSGLSGLIHKNFIFPQFSPVSVLVLIGTIVLIMGLSFNNKRPPDSQAAGQF